MRRPVSASKGPRRTRWVAAALAVSLLCAAGAQAQEEDPWQGMNRATFAFNEWLDMWVLMPVAKGWDFVTPDLVQTGVSNVFATSGMSVVLLNDILQLKPMRAGEDVARIAVNLTVGIAGVFDVATKLGIPENEEDFGQTLGYWGMPPGPYLVLPIFGPSNPRDTVGLIADTASAPWTYFVEWYVSIPVSVFEFINLRTIYLEDIDELREAALDYYVFQRNAYVQSRDLAVNDLESIEEEDEEDLYYFDDELDDEVDDLEEAEEGED
jgi:phospholipid-binding lipoprotein MlaA